MAEHSTGFLWEVPGNESVTILVVPQRMGVGPWMIERRGDGDETVWTGTSWATANRPMEMIYRWTLAEALRQVDNIVAAEAGRHLLWKQQRSQPAEIVDEFLAEFASTAVAS
ncbi:hypothetical protein [Streptacidiphilus carbonis]|uniref:hypothetical protein n=1 Tax=Streptacidiphilus carbonis TaxID=105422 RepID=UPI0005AB454A|nr:hypothetical protein [Streptacidiphilus carbonis]